MITFTFISGGDDPETTTRTSPEAERRLMEAMSIAALLAVTEADPAEVELRDVAAVVARLISEAHELLNRDARE